MHETSIRWVFMESFNFSSQPSGVNVLGRESNSSAHSSPLHIPQRSGLSDQVKPMYANTMLCNYHQSSFITSRKFHSRISNSPASHFGFSVVACETNLNYQTSICPSIGSSCKKFQSLSVWNDSSWSVSDMADSTNGVVIKWGPSGPICTDSRKLHPGQWFFAIVGEHFDGHDFVNQALEDKGCLGVIGNRVCENWGGGFVKVEGDTLIALQKMAKYARNRFHGHVIGLTGSVGKTTTRTMTALALENLGHVYQTRGNQNNHIGVALTLVGMPFSTKVSVLELGMSGQGEILELAQMCCPTVRVVLNVSRCHMENFGSLDAVARAKGELFAEAKPGDICVLNADDPLVMKIPVPSGVKKVLFGQKTGCDVRLVLAESLNGGCAVRVILEHQVGKHGEEDFGSVKRTSEKVDFEIHGPGLHLAMNACAAAAVAVSLGVSLAQVAESLLRFRPVHMRSELEIAGNGIIIINDVYNANLTSMKAAIDTLKAMDCRGKRVAILGDMLELGAAEADAHEAVLKMCCDTHLGLVAVVGYRFLAAVERLKLPADINIMCAKDLGSLALKVTKTLNANDVILVKGSRAMKMEKVVHAIKTINNQQAYRMQE